MARKQSTLKKPVKFRYGDVSLNLPKGISAKQRCVLCGRTGAEALLNIEGTVHHHGKVVCLDTQSCNRTRRKNQRKARGNG